MAGSNGLTFDRQKEILNGAHRMPTPPDWLTTPRGRELFAVVVKAIPFEHRSGDDVVESAAQLAMLWERVETLNATLQSEGAVIDDGRGSLKAHPANALLNNSLMQANVIAGRLRVGKVAVSAKESERLKGQAKRIAGDELDPLMADTSAQRPHHLAN